MANETPRARHFRIQQLTDGVYAAIACPGGGAGGNAGIVDLGGCTILFDSFQTPAAAAELRQAAEDLTGSPVSLVINSHFHADHTLGNQVFHGVPIISTEITRKAHEERGAATVRLYREQGPAHLTELEKRLASMPEGTAREALALQVSTTRFLVNAAPQTEVVLPGVLVEDRLSLVGTRRRAELQVHQGHTLRDLICWLPDDRVCFAGDLVLVANHPWMGHGVPEEWFKTLDRLGQLPVERLVPGHGEVGGPEWIGEVRGYLRAIMAQAEAEAAKGTTPEEALKISAPAPYDRWNFAPGYGRNISFLVGRLVEQRAVQKETEE